MATKKEMKAKYQISENNNRKYYNVNDIIGNIRKYVNGVFNNVSNNDWKQ